MRVSGGMQPEEVAILCKDHSSLCTGVLDMCVVGRAKEACLTHGFDINASFS
jgi:hypothetical protein